MIFGLLIDPFISNCPANKPSFFNPVNNSPTAGTTLSIFDINLIGATEPIILIEFFSMFKLPFAAIPSDSLVR